MADTRPSPAPTPDPTKWRLKPNGDYERITAGTGGGEKVNPENTKIKGVVDPAAEREKFKRRNLPGAVKASPSPRPSPTTSPGAAADALEKRSY